MSKISYCSLEEAWGNSFSKNNGQNIEQNNVQNNIHNNVQNTKISNREMDKYNMLTEKSENDRDIVISNMNNIERNPRTENNSLVQYQKYRFNPSNKVNYNDQQIYSPFNQDLERKYLQDKLMYLENELRKYKHLFEKSDYQINSIESFSNQDSISNNNVPSNNKSNDIIDLILLIMIGLIVIFVMNSIFNIGKAVGAKK
jgi:hypothetical protein